MLRSKRGLKRYAPDLQGTDFTRAMFADASLGAARIVYMPMLHSMWRSCSAQTVTDVLPGVQNEASLGADVTARPAGSTLRGML